MQNFMSYSQLINELKKTGFVNALGDPVSIQGTDYKILFQNDRHKELIGDRHGEYCYRAYRNNDQVCDNCHLAQCFKDGKVHIMEQQGAPASGILYAEITGSPIRDETGKIIAGIEIIRDISDRKAMEKALQKANAVLETRVIERTKELVAVNKTLLDEINERKEIEENLREAENNLKIHSRELEESNTALRVLLKQREQDQHEFGNNILSNMKHLISPYLDKLKKNRSMSEELVYLNLIESNLREIMSPFSSRLSFRYLDFTPREILIANLIKDGKQDKDIVEILNISLETVKSHRQNIRKKLDIYGKRINLRTKLLSLTE